MNEEDRCPHCQAKHGSGATYLCGWPARPCEDDTQAAIRACRAVGIEPVKTERRSAQCQRRQRAAA